MKFFKVISGITVLVSLWLLVPAGPVSAAELMLPFRGGSTWTCDQGNKDCDPTHCEHNSMAYAWDFNTGEGSYGDKGRPVVAPAGGEIIETGYYSGWGNLVIIDYGDGTFGKLAHLEAIRVSEGGYVKQGQTIGTCGGTGGDWPPHIHYQTQDEEGVNSYSVKSTFLDAEEPDGIPKEGGYYTSLNTYNPNNDCRVGKFGNGWRIEPWNTSFGGTFEPYSRPFVLTYYHEGGIKLGYPTDAVHLLTSLEAPGYDPYSNTEPCYIQHIRNTCGGEDRGWLTLVLNPYVYNIRMGYLGVVYPIHGRIRDYWRQHYSEYGPPVSNEYAEEVDGETYVVQWFERSENNYKVITYNINNGNFNEVGSEDLGDKSKHLNQAVYDNLGCPKGKCGRGGNSTESSSPSAPSPSKSPPSSSSSSSEGGGGCFIASILFRPPI